MFLFLLLIPTQLGKHWWPAWSLVDGVRVDYLSPTLYLVDIVWGILVGYAVYDRGYTIKDKKWWVVVGMVVVNVLVAENKWVAAYKWGRIYQLLVTVGLLWSLRKQVTKYLGLIIPIWIVGESLLGWGQIINGGSLQGWWYWLGERRFSYLTIGLARWEIVGRGLVRAYGTFSHPNSMAGFLLVSLMLWTKFREKRDVWYWIVIWLGTLGIIISGSRTVWLLLAGLIIHELRFAGKRMMGVVLVVLGVVMILAGINENYRLSEFLGGWDRDGAAKRVNLAMSAIRMVADYPLLGVGMGNFLVKLPEYQVGNQYWLQPVHNIFLLISAELGVVGWLILNFKFEIFKQLRSILTSSNSKKLWILGVIIATGMVDHYWLTLPQNMWLLVIALII